MGREICGDTTETEGPTEDDPPGTDMDLGTGRGRQGGGEQTWYTAAKTGTRHRAQRLAAEADGRRLGTKSRWTTYHAGR